MRNPLSKRHPRELRNNIGKYLGIFLMMVLAVAFTAGFLLAASSIQVILEEMDERYNVEDGRFSCDFEPEQKALDAVKALGVTLYEDYYKDVPLSIVSAASPDAGAKLTGDDGISSQVTVRVFANRTAVNMPAYAEGRAPETEGEISLDRVFIQNNDLALGDVVNINGHDASIVGIMTLPDNQALFQDNTSFMFNALTFCVAQVTSDFYQTLGSTGESFNYAFFFDDPTLSLAQRNDIEEDMIDALVDNDAVLSNFIDAEDNQGIGYCYDDVTSDQTMWTVLLMLLIVIMAFVFVVLSGATIEQESAVIGTLLASGWRKRELVRHYLTLPALVGLVAVVIGLVLGVTLFSDPMRGLYYNSYSIPPYKMTWNWRVVVITAVVPYVMLVGITLFGLMRKLKFTPLQFLRHEVAGKRRASRIHLPESLRYPTRFRLRVLMRNASHFVTMFFGIMFASLLLLFGTCLMPVMDNYATELAKTIPASYEYMLKTPLELEGTDDEREMYAAALRLVENHERIEDNQSAVDALDRLKDNDELMDALERLQDNEELMDAIDRLQDQTELVDAAKRLENNPAVDAAQRLQSKTELVAAAERLQAKSDLVAAAQRLQNNPDLIAAAQRLQSKPKLLAAAKRLQGKPKLLAAAQRLQSKPKLLAAAQRLQSNPELVAAAQRLQDKQELLEAAQRLQDYPELVAAAERLQSNPGLMEAAQRLQDKQDVVAAAERLADKQDVVEAAQLLQARPDIMEALQRMQAGTATEEDMELLASLDEQTQAAVDIMSSIDEQTQADLETMASIDGQTQADLEFFQNASGQDLVDLQTLSNIDAQTSADLELVANMSEQDKTDLELVSNMDAQTRKDIELMSNVDDQTRKDLELMADIDDKTQADLELVSGMDKQTRKDIELMSNIDSQTQADLEMVSNMDAQTQADIELMSNIDSQTQTDLELMANMDAQTRDDLELLSNIDDQTQDDLDLISNVDAQTRKDLDLLMDLDEDTQADIDLIRNIDEDLLDDLRLAADIDEDAHVVNTKVNPAETLAQAEKFAMGSVEVARQFGGTYETVNVYGIQPNSTYWTDIPVTDGIVFVGRGLPQKTNAKAGEELELINRREGETYTILVADQVSNETDMSIYMTLDDFNRLFDNDVDYFNAYASGEKLVVDDRYLASVITPSDMEAISDQMSDSMGDIANMMLAMSIPIYFILVYLLTKTVIDRNARSISYMKVFGYRNRDVNGLYVRPVTYAVATSLVVSIPLILVLLKLLLKAMMMSYAGNLPIIVPPDRFALQIVVGLVAYVIVALLHIRRIRKVPLSLALKVQE